MSKTLYALVGYIGSDGTAHERGDAVEFEDDAATADLTRHGVLSEIAPRRQAGDSSARVKPDEA